MMTLLEMKKHMMATKYFDTPRVKAKRQLTYAITELNQNKDLGLTLRKQVLMEKVLDAAKNLQKIIEEEECSQQ